MSAVISNMNAPPMLLANDLRKEKAALTFSAGAVAGASILICYGLAYELIDCFSR